METNWHKGSRIHRQGTAEFLSARQKLTPQFVVEFKGYEEVDQKDVEELWEFHAEEIFLLVIF